MNYTTISSYLPVYNSTLGLSSRLADIIYFFVVPGISIAGIIEKSVSILVLHKILAKNERNYLKNQYYYMLTNETIDLLNCFIILFTILIRCGVYCSYAYTYWAKLYEMILYTYMTNTLQQCQTFLEISFCLERLQSFSASNHRKIQYKIKLLIWLVVAFVVTMPSYLMTRQVVPIGILSNRLTSLELLYGVTNNFLGTNPYVAIGLFVLSLLRGFFMYIILLAISLMVIFKFRNHLKRKETIIRDHPNNLATHNDPQNKSNKKKNKKKENRVTKMVLSMSLNYIIGSFLGSLSPILFQIGIGSTFYAYYGTVANLVSYLSHGTYIVWYFKFNTKFRNVFLQTFCTEPEEHPVYNARPRLIKPTSKSNKNT